MVCGGWKDGRGVAGILWRSALEGCLIPMAGHRRIFLLCDERHTLHGTWSAGVSGRASYERCRARERERERAAERVDFMPLPLFLYKTATNRW